MSTRMSRKGVLRAGKSGLKEMEQHLRAQGSFALQAPTLSIESSRLGSVVGFGPGYFGIGVSEAGRLRFRRFGPRAGAGDSLSQDVVEGMTNRPRAVLIPK